MAALLRAPDGNHGDILHMAIPQNLAVATPRPRLSIELSAVVSSHLDHISDITGETKASIVSGALLEALPELLARADGLKKRANELTNSKAQSRK